MVVSDDVHVIFDDVHMVFDDDWWHLMRFKESYCAYLNTTFPGPGNGKRSKNNRPRDR